MNEKTPPKTPAVVKLRTLLVSRGIEMPAPSRTTTHVGTVATHTSTYALTVGSKQFIGTGTGSCYRDSDNAAAEALLPQIERTVSGMPKVFKPQQKVRGSHKKLFAEGRYEQALVALCRDKGLDPPTIVEKNHAPVATKRVEGPQRTIFTYVASSGKFTATAQRLKAADARGVTCCSLYATILKEFPDPPAA